MNYLTGRTTISFHDIYDRLGREEVGNTSYHHGDGELIKDFFTFPIMYPQNVNGMGEMINSIHDMYTDSFNKGTYFHFKSTRKANERMIINLSTQQEATMLVRDTLYRSYNVISHIKFFAAKQASPIKHLKCDKIVIYYDRANRNVVFQTVCNAAKSRGYDFKRELSAFYHIVGDDEGKYPVGIGIELMASSFTENRTAEILEALTGVKRAEKKNKQYDILAPSYEKSFFDVLYNNIIRHLPVY